MTSPRLPVQICPICRAQQPVEALRCATCGAALSGAPIAQMSDAAQTPGSGRDRGARGKAKVSLDGPPGVAWDEGDADLHEGVLPTLPLRLLTLSVAVIALFALAGFFVVSQGTITAPTGTHTPTMTLTAQVAAVKASRSATPLPTNTKSLAPTVMPTLDLATDTLAPPTPTITPTRGPCIQKAAKGDTIYGMAARCGHKHLSIVAVVIDLNNLKDANSLQEGQVLTIPWPTPTGGALVDSGGTGNTPDPGNLTPTLPAGVAWYTVRKGDTAVGIVAHFHISMKILRDLNPEIEFLQCDFGLPAGGTSCTLRPMLGAEQRVRVSAPTPTPSLSPTYTGSETVTPTGTATFNAPPSDAPDNNMMYDAGDLPALRWTASGKLDATQVYLITVP